MNNVKMIEICSEKLRGISEQVAAQDKKDLMQEFQISDVTVWRYLQGKVGNIDLGVKMYEFLNSRIEKRKEVLSA